MRHKMISTLAYTRQLFEESEQAGASSAEEVNGTESQDGNESEQPKTYTEEEVNALIARKKSEWKKATQKQIDEAKKLESMTAQERAEHERDELQKQLDEYKRKDALAEMTKTARKIASDAGVTIPDEVLDAIVTDDAETTKTHVDAYVKAFKSAVQAEVKAQLTGKAPKTGAVTGMTKEQIMAEKDRTKRQALIAAHMELFKK